MAGETDDSTVDPAPEDTTEQVDTDVVADDQLEQPVDDQQQTDDQTLGESQVDVDGEGGTDAAGAIPQDAWRQVATEAGFVDVDSPDDAITRAAEAIRARDEQLSQLTQQIRFYQDQQRHTPTPQPHDPADNQTTDPYSDLIGQWEDPAWVEKYIEVDQETGRRTIREDVDDTTRQRIMDTDRRVREWQGVLENPARLTEMLDRRVEQLIQERFDSGWSERTQQQQDNAAIQSFVDENEGWLYQVDPITKQVIRDPVSGLPAYSREGQEFVGYMNQAANDGVANVQRQIAYAQTAIQVARQQRQEQPAQRRQQAQSVAADKRRQMQGRKATQQRQTAINGVTPEDGEQPTGADQLSFGQQTLHAMKIGTDG